MDLVNLKHIANNKLDEVCRLCSTITSYLMSISSHEIIPMIEECAPVNVTIGDNLPQSICKECFNLLEKIVSFRKICIESEIKFLKDCHKVQNDCNNPPVCKIETNPDQQTDSENELDENGTAVENNEDIKIKNEGPKEEVNTPYVSDCDNNDLPDMEFSDSDSEPLIKFKVEKRKAKIKSKKRNGKDRVTRFKCEICSKGKEYSWRGIIYHKERTHSIRPLKCPFCPKKFFHEPQLQSHKLEKHELFKCNHCHQRFTRRMYLKAHFTTNPGHEKQYKCSLCEEWFEKITVLRQHERKIHNKRRKRVKTECPVCHKTCDKSNLNAHLMIHKPRGKLNCPNCPKTFYYQSTLDDHKRRAHEPYVEIEKPKNYLCNLCGKATINKSYLERHLRSHATDKPYRCDQCPKAYKQPFSLKNHINHAHLNLRPHVCPQCGLGFFVNRTLEDHIRTHTGEKPFKCEICEHASFGSKAGLYLHTQAYHVSKPPVLSMFKFTDSI